MIGIRIRFFKQKYLQKYYHLQPPDAAGFCHGELILNHVTNFSTKITYTSLEVRDTEITTKIYMKNSFQY